MNVRVIPVAQDGDFFWMIHENGTGKNIHFFYFEDEAKDYAVFINKGGAFDGFTPDFMIAKLKMSVDNMFIAKIGA